MAYEFWKYIAEGKAVEFVGNPYRILAEGTVLACNENGKKANFGGLHDILHLAICFIIA